MLHRAQPLWDGEDQADLGHLLVTAQRQRLQPCLGLVLVRHEVEQVDDVVQHQQRIWGRWYPDPLLVILDPHTGLRVVERATQNQLLHGHLEAFGHGQLLPALLGGWRGVLLNAQYGATYEPCGGRLEGHKLVEVLLGSVSGHGQKWPVDASVQRVQLVSDRCSTCYEVGLLAVLLHVLFDLHQLLAQVPPDLLLEVTRHQQSTVGLGVCRHQKPQNAFQIRRPRLLGGVDPLEQEADLVHHEQRRLVPRQVPGDFLL